MKRYVTHVVHQIIKSMSNKVCEGRMQLYDVKRSKWRTVYTVVTDSEVFIYGMQVRGLSLSKWYDCERYRYQQPLYVGYVQRETATSRMGYKVGKSKFAIGHLEAGPYPLAGIQVGLCVGSFYC